MTQDSYTGNPYDPWTQNLYAYCGNNPVNFVDPTGHVFWFVPCIFIAFLGGGALLSGCSSDASNVEPQIVDVHPVHFDYNKLLMKNAANTADQALTDYILGGVPVINEVSTIKSLFDLKDKLQYIDKGRDDLKNNLINIVNYGSGNITDAAKLHPICGCQPTQALLKDYKKQYDSMVEMKDIFIHKDFEGKSWDDLGKIEIKKKNNPNVKTAQDLILGNRTLWNGYLEKQIINFYSWLTTK